MAPHRRTRSSWWSALVGAIVLRAAMAHGGTVAVFAAASLTDAFRTMGETFEAAHRDTKIEFNFAGSSTLARQIVEGAPAAVFASADEESMQKVAGEVVDAPKVFARNRLAIVVPKGNPQHVTGLADLARPGLTIALAAPAVPAGRYALEAFAKAKVPAPAGSNEADVKAVVTRVAMGEADAGVVYATDVRTGGERVEGVAVPEAHDVLARYPIATLRGATSAAGARAFVAYVLSPSGQRALTDAGFLGP